MGIHLKREKDGRPLLPDGIVIAVGQTAVGSAVFIYTYFSELPLFRHSPAPEFLMFTVFTVICLFLWRTAISLESAKQRFRREFIPLRSCYLLLGGFAQIALHLVLGVRVTSIMGTVLVAILLLSIYQACVALTSRFPGTSAAVFAGLLAVALGALSIAPAAALLVDWLT